MEACTSISAADAQSAAEQAIHYHPLRLSYRLDDYVFALRSEFGASVSSVPPYMMHVCMRLDILSR